MEKDKEDTETEMEVPECPVCLQQYNTTSTIPRVLPCGHSTCQSCISNLHKLHLSAAPINPNTLRCPCCTHLLPFNSHLGPTSLPKNLDLLHFSNPTNNNGCKSISNGPNSSLCSHSKSWVLQGGGGVIDGPNSSHWKSWVLPYDAVRQGQGQGQGGVNDGPNSSLYSQSKSWAFQGGGGVINGGVGFMGGGFIRVVGDKEVGFVKLGRFEMSDSGFRYGYMGKIMSVLGKMSGGLRDEIEFLLGFCLRNSRVCDCLGLWLDDGGFVYLVFVKLSNGGLLELEDFEWSYLESIGVELCECLMSLNSEGVVCGCLGLSCVCFDEFGRVCVDLGEVLCVGGKFRECIVEGVVGEQRNEEFEVEAVIVKLSNVGAFVAPEIVLELLRWEVEVEKNDVSFAVCGKSDVWLLACVLIRFFFVNQFDVEMYSYLKPVFRGDNEGVHQCKDLYLQWVETIKALFQPYVDNDCGTSVYEILVKCLDFDPKSRPLITDVWKCMKELNKSHFTKHVPSLNREYYKVKGYQCLLLGELCNMSNDRRHESKMSKLHEAQDDSKADLGLAMKAGVGNAVEGVSVGKMQCKNLQGHLDCITGLCVGGGYLFSSSFDKTVSVWSLQDFTHVHTFRGHENRVMALVFVNEEKPLCISADIGGGIFAWEISNPLPQEPLKKWFEEKDWRYSGIHALAVSESGCLYTGSGDRLIKVWLLRDCTLVCSMEGHKSVVSTLALNNGVLYSGSWDGTVRLWCLHDHSPLAVFGEDIHGTVSSVLSLYADQNLTIASYENGCMKIWVNDVLKSSTKIHDKAIFALAMEGKWLFSGGWDRAVKFQEVTGDGFDMDIIEVGSIACDSVITALLCDQGLLFVGYANKLIKVYHCDMFGT